MEIKEYLDKKKMIQDSIHEYIIEEERTEEIYQNIEQNSEEQQIQKSKQDFQELLHLISKISNNHNRKNNFLSKILNIILHFTEEISNYFSNTEIFNIFKNNKKSHLFLFEEGLIKPDSYIAHSMTCGKYIKASYPLYFAPEIKSFIQDENILKNILSKTNGKR